MTLLKLFWSFFQIGLFSFGGGYAAMPFIQEQAVDINGWLTMGEFVDLVTISQMTPGPIAINAATFIGMKTSGVVGAVIATIGCVTPSCIIVLTLAFLYYKYRELPAIQGVLKGLRPAVVSLIAFAGISIVQMALFGEQSGSLFNIDLSSFDVISGILFAVALFVMRRFKPNPIYVMAGAGCVGLIAYYII